MVDREARDRVAELLRHFASGRMTNTAFLSSIPERTNDRSLERILDVIHFSCDGGPYENQRLSRKTRREFGQIVLFLHSDIDGCSKGCKWWSLPAGLILLPTLPIWWLATLCAVIAKSFGIIGCKASAEDEQDPDDIWPFDTEMEYQQALCHPRLLCGKQA